MPKHANHQIKKVIAASDWTKYWSGSWSLLAGSLFAYYYTHLMKKQMGAGLSRVVLISRKGYTACCFEAGDRKKFGTHLGKKFARTPQSVRVFCNTLKRKADKMMIFSKSLTKKKSITVKDFQKWLKLFYDYTGPHISPRNIVDYLPPQKLKKMMPYLEDARLYTEPVFKITEEFMQAWAKQIGKKEGYKPEYVLCLLQKELESYLKHGVLPNKKILKERFTGSALIVFGKTSQMFTGNAVTKLEDTLVAIQQKGIVKKSATRTGRVDIKFKKFEKEIWTKNWSGNWGLLFGSLYGDIYTKGLEELTGRYFHHNLVIFENGVSSNYLIQKELNKYCSHLVSLISKDKTLTKRWSDQVIKNTDKIFALMKNIDKRKSFSKKDYFELQNIRSTITTANFSIKKVIDYLPADLAEKNLELFSKVRVYTEPVYNETDRLLYKVVYCLLNKKLSKKAIAVLTTDELEEYFINKKLPPSKILDSRYKGCALFFDKKGKGRMFQDNKFKEIMSSITSKLASQEIKGMVAYNGKATGRVKVVFDPEKCKDFQKGDILVAGMTRPEYLGLMKKSAAFITDAGGMLCHAAIVARELKKPCLVGTEIATKVLKDGDRVEVDAVKGIVRKL